MYDLRKVCVTDTGRTWKSVGCSLTLLSLVILQQLADGKLVDLESLITYEIDNEFNSIHYMIGQVNLTWYESREKVDISDYVNSGT